MYNYKELVKYINPKIDELVKLYKKNPYYARVLFMNAGSHDYKQYQIVRFDIGNSNDMDIVCFCKSYGVNKINRMYSNEKRLFTVRVRGAKFYITNSYGIRNLSISKLRNYSIPYESNGEYSNLTNIIIDELTKTYGWVRFVDENYFLHSLSFNSIIKYKLYSYKKALRHLFGFPYPLCKILVEYLGSRNSEAVYNMKHYIEYMVNIENLHTTLPTYDFTMFYDTLKLAKTLNYKVNCSWSSNRLKFEHDKWAKELNNIIFMQNDKPLNIKEVYLDFSNFSGYKILKSTKEMAQEGLRNNNCVSSYVNSVNKGRCGLFVIEDCTVELRLFKKSLHITQISYYNNNKAPDDVVERINDKISEFNSNYEFQDLELIDELFEF